jgi:two-component system sensor histidine kinase KdpD
VKRRLLGTIVGITSALAFAGVLYPLRSQVNVSTTALVLVIPVVLGAAIGGFRAGAVSVAAGFLIFDYVFVPPFGTLDVSSTQDWVALVVYVAVMLLVARIVDTLEHTRYDASRGHEAIRRVFEVSELLVGDQPVDALLATIVNSAQTIFDVPGVSLLELEEGRLVVVASAGDALNEDELRQLEPNSGMPVHVGTVPGSADELRTVALTSSGRPMGILAMRGALSRESERSLLNTFANDAALALERAQLREQAIKSQLLEEADRFRHGLMGAVSHDLRTPLATIKVASSTLSHRADTLSKEDVHELHVLMEIETDRLTRLVTNLLDMTRIEAGVLTLHREPTEISDLVHDALSAISSLLSLDRVTLEVTSAPTVYVDRVLIGQVLLNLLDNAVRHAPSNSVISVSSELRHDDVVVVVGDRGPGVAPADRSSIFDRFTQFNTGGRAGLGLTIAKTFIEAHGERLWYEEGSEGGASFVFSLPSTHDNLVTAPHPARPSRPANP